MPAILYCYSNMGRHYIHEYLTQSVRSHEYNAYPYLNNNKVWPAWIILILIGQIRNFKIRGGQGDALVVAIPSISYGIFKMVKLGS